MANGKQLNQGIESIWVAGGDYAHARVGHADVSKIIEKNDGWFYVFKKLEGGNGDFAHELSYKINAIHVDTVCYERSTK